MAVIYPKTVKVSYEGASYEVRMRGEDRDSWWIAPADGETFDLSVVDDADDWHSIADLAAEAAEKEG